MKTYDQLTLQQQKKAKEYLLNDLLECIASGGIRFDDSLQTRIDAAIARSEYMRTPWFAAEYILEYCGEDIRNLAYAKAEQCLYPESDEKVITGIAI